MRFTKIRGWNAIKFAENDIFVPLRQEDGLGDPSYEAGLRLGGTPSPRFFSQLVIPANFENVHNLKYVELTLEYDSEHDPPLTKLYYGWVDSIIMRDHLTSTLNWHVDCWRTYWRYLVESHGVIRGWITRRRPRGNYWDPPQNVPTNYYIPSGDVVQLGDQLDGINWVIITFAANLGELGALISSVNKIPLVGGLATSLFKKVCDVPGMILGDADMLEEAKENIPYYPTASPDIYCLTFPVMLDADQNAYFKLTGMRVIFNEEYGEDMRRERKETYICPSVKEILSGDLMKALGIKGDKVLSCAISPICPLKVKSGNGSENDPVEIKSPISLEYGYEGRTQIPKIKFERNGGRGILKVNVDYDLTDIREEDSFGIYDAGMIEDRCPNLGNLLTRFCFDPNFHAEITDIDETENFETVRRIIIDATGEEKLQKYMRFDHYVQMVTRRPPGLVRPRRGETLPLYRLPAPPEYNWKYYERETQEEIHGNLTPVYVTTWEPHQSFSMHGFEQYIFDPAPIRAHYINGKWTLYFRGNLGGEVKETYDGAEIYVKLHKGQDRYGYDVIKGPDIIGIKRDDLIGVNATRFCINALQPRYFLNASTLLWPIHYVKLKAPMQTDASRILVLIGAHGEIIHQFRQNQVITFYTYETVISQTQVYIRFRFSSSFSMAGDAEVTVPLQSIPLPSNQMNEYLANGGRMMDIMTSKAQSENAEEKTDTSFKYDILAAAFGAVATGGGALPILKNFATSAISAGVQHEKAKAMNEINDAMSDRMQQLKDAKEMMGGGMMAVQGSLADAHDPVPLCLTYLMRDTSAVDNYYKSTQITGITVNERTEDLFKRWTYGPIQVKEPVIICDGIPIEGIEVIKAFLAKGVFACHDPGEMN